MAEFRTLSEFFDDVIADNLGRDPEHIFDAPRNLTVKKESYTDPRGTVAARLTYFDDTGKVVSVKNFINNKVVNTIPPAIVDALEEVPVSENEASALSTLPPPLVKGDSYPNFNLSFVQDVGMKIVFDVAGIDDDRVQITFGGDYLNIHIAAEPENPAPIEVFLVKSIDNPSQEYKRSIYIDTSKYSIKDLQYSIKNGEVQIIIPYNDKKENLMVFKPTGRTTQKSKQRLVEKTSEK